MADKKPDTPKKEFSPLDIPGYEQRQIDRGTPPRGNKNIQIDAKQKLDQILSRQKAAKAKTQPYPSRENTAATASTEPTPDAVETITVTTPDIAAEIEISEWQLRTLAIDSIAPNPNQPRTHIDPDNIKELAASIQEQGLLSPIHVKKDADGILTLIAGQQRIEAVKQLGHDTIRAYVTDNNDPERSALISFVENAVRTNLSPLEEAAYLKTLKDKYNMSASTIAKQTGKGKRRIEQLLQLTTFDNDILTLLQNNKIAAKNCKALQDLKRNTPEAYDRIKTMDYISPSMLKESAQTIPEPPAATPATAPLPKHAAPTLDNDTADRIARECQSLSLTRKKTLSSAEQNQVAVIKHILQLLPDKTQAAEAILVSRKLTTKHEKALQGPSQVPGNDSTS